MNIFTVDVEDWFNLLDVNSLTDLKSWSDYEERAYVGLNIILKALENRGVQGLFFLLGWTVERNPSIVDRIVSAGHMIGTHSYDHGLVYLKNQKTFEEDLEKSIEIIYKISGIYPVAYRAPGFSITIDQSWFIESLKKFSIGIDASVCAMQRAHGGDIRFNIDKPVNLKYKEHSITELPINSGSLLGKKLIFSGGGYFRFYPSVLLKYLALKNNYNMFYFHPRDFDPSQPRIKSLEPIRYFKSYVGLKGSADKLNYLMDSIHFENADILTKPSFLENLNTILLK